MEEKDVKFTIFKNRENIDVSSDIDEYLDYLDDEDITALYSKIIGILYAKTVAENEDEDDEVIENKFEEIRGRLIYWLLNITEFATKQCKGEKPEIVDYALVTFVTAFNRFGDKVLASEDSYYSDNVEAFDGFQGAFIMFLDSISALLNGGVSKQDVTNIINSSIELMRKDFIRYIDDFDNEEDE